MNCLGNATSVARWHKEHDPHGLAVRSYPKAQPLSYRIFILTCPCGAKLLDMERPAQEAGVTINSDLRN